MPKHTLLTVIPSCQHLILLLIFSCYLLFPLISTANNTTTPCKDKIASMPGPWPDITGCYIPEYRFQRPKSWSDPNNEEGGNTMIPNDQILNVNAACDRTIYDFSITGNQAARWYTCARNDYIDDVDEICNYFITYRNNNVTDEFPIGEPSIRLIDLSLDNHMPLSDADNPNWYALDPPPTANQQRAQVGQKFKRQKCLELFLQEWAHRGDCGEIVLDDAPSDISINNCQMVQAHDALRSEIFDAMNFHGISYETQAVDSQGDLVVDGNGDPVMATNNSRGNIFPMFKVCPTRGGPLSGSPLGEGKKVTDQLLGAPPNSPFQSWKKIHFPVRGCPAYEGVTRMNYFGLEEHVPTGSRQCDLSIGHRYEDNTSKGGGQPNGARAYDDPRIDAETLIKSSSGGGPAGDVLRDMRANLPTPPSGVPYPDFQVGLTEQAFVGPTNEKFWPRSYDSTPETAAVNNENPPHVRVERIREVCHPYGTRSNVYAYTESSTGGTPVPRVDTAQGLDIARWFGYDAGRCSNWKDQLGRTHNNIDILEMRLERFDVLFNDAFQSGSNCEDFQCSCPPDDPTTPDIDEYQVCIDTIIVPNYSRWLECFQQARNLACPVVERDVSTTVPYDRLVHFESLLNFWENERWMVEEPNILATRPSTIPKHSNLNPPWTNAPFMAPNIPYASPKGTHRVGGQQDYNNDFQNTQIKFRQNASLSSRSNEEIIGPRGCHIGGWYELMLYQARCTRRFGLNCLCDYESTFLEGSAEQYVLEAAGANLDYVQEGASTNLPMKWPLVWRGYAGPNYAAGGDIKARLWDYHRMENPPGSGQYLFPEGYAGLDCVKRGDFIIWDEEVLDANTENDPPEGTSADSYKCENLTGIEKEWRCYDPGDGNYKPKDARYRRHIAYVEDVGFKQYSPENPYNVGHARADPDNPFSFDDLGEPYFDPLDADLPYDPLEPCKIKKNDDEGNPLENVKKFIVVSEFNYGKNLDTCGNTDRWGVKTTRTIWEPGAENSPITRECSGSIECLEKHSCADPDNAICVEKNWGRVKVYRPSEDAYHDFNPNNPDTLLNIDTAYPEPGTPQNPGLRYGPADLLPPDLQTPTNNLTYMCKGPEKITVENADTPFKKDNIGRYLRDPSDNSPDSIDIIKALQKRIGVCDPPKELAGGVRPASTIVANLRRSAPRESRQGYERTEDDEGGPAVLDWPRMISNPPPTQPPQGFIIPDENRNPLAFEDRQDPPGCACKQIANNDYWACLQIYPETRCRNHANTSYVACRVIRNESIGNYSPEEDCCEDSPNYVTCSTFATSTCSCQAHANSAFWRCAAASNSIQNPNCQSAGQQSYSACNTAQNIALGTFTPSSNNCCSDDPNDIGVCNLQEIEDYNTSAPDTDGDGIPDDIDNDDDNDGIPDSIDPDDDNDGIPDSEEDDDEDDEDECTCRQQANDVYWSCFNSSGGPSSCNTAARDTFDVCSGGGLPYGPGGDCCEESPCGQDPNLCISCVLQASGVYWQVLNSTSSTSEAHDAARAFHQNCYNECLALGFSSGQCGSSWGSPGPCCEGVQCGPQ